MKLQLKNFKIIQQSKALQISQCSWNNTGSTYVLDSDNFTSLIDIEPKTKKKKSFSELKSKMMQNFNYELLKTFKDFIVSENDIISVNNMISLNQVLGYLLSCAKH